MKHAMKLYSIERGPCEESPFKFDNNGYIMEPFDGSNLSDFEKAMFMILHNTTQKENK